MTARGIPGSSNGDYGGAGSQNGGGPQFEGREPGARRKKFAGYLRAANEMRQAYVNSYSSQWARKDSSAEEFDGDSSGAFPDAAIVRSGEEEMILFPSYARKHTKVKPEADPGGLQTVPGQGRDVRDTTGAGDAEYWREQWEKYENDNAVVDVDVHGWIYSPFKGQMSRKQRLFVGLARQLVGLPAPTSSQSPAESEASSRASSPHDPMRLGGTRRDEEVVSREAEAIVKKGQAEADAAGRGEYSEKPSSLWDNSSVYSAPPSRSTSPVRQGVSKDASQIRRVLTDNSLADDNASVSSRRKRASWNQPAKMSPAELLVANGHLMARLKHFMAVPLANTPVSAFFYNENASRQKTIYTNAAGHFSLRAALEFVPTHVRVLAGEKLSATEEIHITEPQGVSLISDIDDTIKHSAIASGAREIFRNAFIRELADLTIEGVKEWYTRLADMGVKIHYVSNSPWQIYPVLSQFFALAGLPRGSFHLKQYSGMLQGIFEPVAERKKSTLDKLAKDFPERRFLLVGDSGEADLEVYTEFVLENPGRVLGVFIRDVTTPEVNGFFDSYVGALNGDRTAKPTAPVNGRSYSTRAHSGSEEDDPDLRAAIAASLQDVERSNTDKQRSMSFYDSVPCRKPLVRSPEALETTLHPESSNPQRPMSSSEMRRQNSEPLIDLHDDANYFSQHRALSSPKPRPQPSSRPSQGQRFSTISKTPQSPPPARPPKPSALRQPSGDEIGQPPGQNGPPSASTSPLPPRPREPSKVGKNLGARGP